MTLIGFVLLFSTMGPAVHADELRLGISPEPYMPFTQINQASVWEAILLFY